MRILTFACAAVLLAGCTITDTTVVNTRLFKGDIKLMHAGYKEVRKLKRGEATINDVEQIGFRVQFEHRTPNVECVTGAMAFRRIFGDTIYQGAFNSAKKLAQEKGGEDAVRALIDAVEAYEAYFVPFKVIVTESDRYYWSEKEILRKGDDLMIILLFDGEKFVHIDWRHLKIDTRDSTYAFAQGLIDILKEYLGPASALNDFYQKIRDQIKPPSTP